MQSFLGSGFETIVIKSKMIVPKIGIILFNFPKKYRIVPKTDIILFSLKKIPVIPKF